MDHSTVTIPLPSTLVECRLERMAVSSGANGNPKPQDHFPETLPKNWSPGSLHLEWKRCGALRCKCTQGLLHGPYVYRHRRRGTKQEKSYVPVRDLALVIEELELLKADTLHPAMMRQALKALSHD